MQRAKNIQRLINLTCVNRRSGNPHLILSPVYYSIWDDNKVERNTDIIQAVVCSPPYIICFIKVPYNNHYGNVYHIEELVAFTDKEGNLLDFLALNNWKITSFGIDSEGYINGVSLLSNDDVNFILKPSNSKSRLKFQHHWQMLIEIDKNCNTPIEAKLYQDFFITKNKLDKAELSITDFKEQLDRKDDIISQYEELLEKFQEIVEKSETISKT
ncbi:hypothetical protein EZ456_23815 [Pedobacter psychrodurus]|uniref:Uncharacterized protein n=1 Tax=Pedobacter psychrodurus TaxID=2530456 RepID=A0A4R0PJG7_9SPHI|nr:hypothetical protein [Pedobacter psychrodurus]TCD16978.1 hypothetical protein EZ456_23815 [Pedobacter psychrodurus]